MENYLQMIENNSKTATEVIINMQNALNIKHANQAYINSLYDFLYDNTSKIKFKEINCALCKAFLCYEQEDTGYYVSMSTNIEPKLICKKCKIIREIKE